MNKVLYNVLSRIPIFGLIVEHKYNFFALQCSPFLEEILNTEKYKPLMDWLKEHPDQVLSRKKARELLMKTKL